MIHLSLPSSAESPLRVLCIGAHCDDIEIGAGGLLRRWIAEHPEVDVCWAIFASNAERAAEANASAAWFLDGAREVLVKIHEFRESFFPDSWSQIKEQLFQLREAFPADVVLTHRLEDRHQDHRVLAELSWNTFRDHLILAYEIAKYEGDLGHPNVFAPLLESEAREKAEALGRFYASQRTKPWFGAEAFLGLMRLRGLECNAPEGYAEAFHVNKLCL